MIIFSFESFSQASNPLTTEFLEGLPPSVREELTLNNAVKKEEELEKLFRADTEFDKTKDVLEKIRYELKAIESRLSRSDKSNEVGLKGLAIVSLAPFNHLLCQLMFPAPQVNM